MQPFQERVIQEKKELDDKIAKLRDFIEGPIFMTLSVPEQGRLIHQKYAMLAYSSILGERIEVFQ